MTIKVAKTSGFCFGVQRAVDTAFENSSKNICTLGALIHNKSVTDKLAQKGVEIIENINQANGRTILIRAHGVTKKIYSQIKDLGINYIDCTCPFVKKIHKLVEENYKLNKKIIIIGNPNHPEIIGINSFADNMAFILENFDQANKFTKNNLFIDIDKIDRNKKNKIDYVLVSQTTFDFSEFKKIVSLFSKYQNIKVFDTICNTTKKRQSEAEYLSKISDKMIVIGDPQSSNTTKLFRVCQKNCCNTFFIHNTSDLDLKRFCIGDKIGIIAGASTPLDVIKEAICFMTPSSDEKSFEQLLDESFVTLHSGQVVHGTIIQVYDNEVVLDLGYKSDGIITKENYSDNLELLNIESLKEIAKVGDEVDAVIYRVDDENGHVYLSKKKVDLRNGFKSIQKAFENNEIVMGKIINIVRGGAIVLANNIRLFVPGSHLFSSPVDNLKDYIGQTLDFNIIEFDPAKHKFIASRKNIEQEKKQREQEELFSDAQLNQWKQGTVIKIFDFGLLVDLGNCVGLVHKSQISWKDNSDFKDKFNIGDKVDVCIIKIDKESKKIYLTMRKPEDNPWNILDIEQKYPVDSIVTGRVSRVNNYGAFVLLEPHVGGLLHISKISNEHIKNINDKLYVGDIVKTKILAIDKEKKRMSLSMIGVDQ